MFSQISPVLIRASLVFLIMLSLSIISVTISWLYMDAAWQEQQSATRGMRTWQNKINNSVSNNQIIEKFETDFLKLVDQGVVGEEDRLSWFETLQNTAKKRGMPLVKYSISSQDALKEKSLSREFTGINVYKSIMTLDITMAHEGDLFALLNNLDKADGLYTVDKCDIEKYSDDPGIMNDMKARCEIGWYTFRGAKADKKTDNNKRRRTG